MLKNFFKITFRNLWRNKGFSAINISGLAIGMGAAIMILLWVQNEISYDRFHEKADRIYMMYNRDHFNGGIWAWNNTPKPMAAALKTNYPEVEDAVRYSNITFLTTVGEKHLNTQGAFVDSGFLSVFSYPLLKGNAKNSLRDLHNIVLTKKLAVKLFGQEDPMGKMVRIDSSENFTVTGVLQDLPPNTALDFEYLLPWAFMTKLGWDDLYWENNSVSTFALLKPGGSQAGFDAKVKNITIDHTKGKDPSTTEVFTQPLKRYHLYSKSVNGKLEDGRISMVRLFMIIAAFILLIACINFMNLSTARSEKRAKEVGIRKVVGAYKSSLVAQFIGESVLISLFAFIIALLLVRLSLKGFNQIVGVDLSIDPGNPYFWIAAMAFVLLTGLIAGSYPAFYLSASKPIMVLKGGFQKVHALVTPRKVLVVLQFSFAILLIICTVIVENQIQYAQNRDTGYKKDNLVYTFTQGDVKKHYALIKHDLLNSGAAVAVTMTSAPITQHWSDGWGFSWPGSTEADKKLDFIRMAADADFVKTTGMTLLAGRDIDIKNYPTDSTATLLNEAAVNAMRLKDPLGKTVNDNGNARPMHVVGIIRDFILESPYETVKPMVIEGPADWLQVVHFKLNPANTTADNIAKAEKIFRMYNPQYPFEYIFVDESYGKKFREERRTGTLAALFAGLTIFISCLGLFGLATYMAENRIREIGVRKVLGASVSGIAVLLSRDFIQLVLISILIASPIAWWAMHHWLQGYNYHIRIGWWVFAASGGLAILIALLTVSYQAIRAATANPVKSLRTQ